MHPHQPRIGFVSPQRASVIENSALSAAITTSQAETMPVPPPKQPPCTSATVGIGNRFSRCTASNVAFETASFASGPFASNCSTTLAPALSSSASGTTSWTRPIRRASSAPNRSPLSGVAADFRTPMASQSCGMMIAAIWPHRVDPFQVRAGLKMLAVASQDDDAQRRLFAERIHRRQHAADETAIIGIVDLRTVQREVCDPSFVEVPQDRVFGHRAAPSLASPKRQVGTMPRHP